MSYSIIEERLVNSNGRSGAGSKDQHYAVVESGQGRVKLRLSSVDADMLWLSADRLDEDGEAAIPLPSFLDAITGLRVLAGAVVESDPEADDVRERAARVVERIAQRLDSGDETDKTLATDLRSTFLSLIDRATRRDP